MGCNMDARAAEDEQRKRRRVDPYWVEPVRRFLAARGVTKVCVSFCQTDVSFFVSFDVDKLKVNVLIYDTEEDEITITIEDEFVIKYCLALMKSKNVRWTVDKSEVISFYIKHPPFKLVKNKTEWVFLNTEVPKKYSLVNRDASIRSFLNDHGLDNDAIIVLKLPGVSYYVYLDSTKSGIQRKSTFTPTTRFEPDVFWAMNEEGWIKSTTTYPYKIIFIVEKKDEPHPICHKSIVKPTFTHGNTYLLPDDVEKFVRECNCNNMLYTFSAFNHVLFDVRYREEIDKSTIEKTYGLKPGSIPRQMVDIERIETAKNGSHMFILHNPLSENEIQLICHILRDGFLIDITSERMWVMFSGPGEYEHYALRYGV